MRAALPSGAAVSSIAQISARRRLQCNLNLKLNPHRNVRSPKCVESVRHSGRLCMFAGVRSAAGGFALSSAHHRRYLRVRLLHTHRQRRLRQYPAAPRRERAQGQPARDKQSSDAGSWRRVGLQCLRSCRLNHPLILFPCTWPARVRMFGESISPGRWFRKRRATCRSCRNGDFSTTSTMWIRRSRSPNGFARIGRIGHRSARVCSAGLEPWSVDSLRFAEPGNDASLRTPACEGSHSIRWSF